MNLANKIFITVLFAFLFSQSAFNQISVASFKSLPSDQTARITHPIFDQNGEKCALIKVVTRESGFAWEGGLLGTPIKTEKKTGEYWLYVSHGASKLTIKHDKLGVLRDYAYPESIREATVYEMVLTTGRVVTTIEAPVIESVWLMINSDPSGADLYIDDTYVGQTPFQKKLTKQKYNYRLTKEKHQPSAGVVDLTNETERKMLDINLQPDYGRIYLTTQPENGAEVILDGNPTGKTTPCYLEEVMTGTHRVKLRRQWYEPLEKEIVMTAGGDQNLTLNLIPAYGEISITTNPEADIYIDNQKKATGTHKTRLTPGVYTISAQKEKHHKHEQVIEIRTGDSKTLSLNPRPQYGSLDVASTPWEAEIKLNGQSYGTTPKTIGNLLVGTYTLTLTKQGYAPHTAEITISEGKTEGVNVTLPSGRQLIINSNPSGAKVYIDNVFKGTTPLQAELSFGSHSIKLTKQDYQDLSRSTEITAGSSNLNYTLEPIRKAPDNMVFVKGGCFQMGSNSGDDDEKPLHEVCVGDFYIGKYEVTQELWKDIMGSNPSNFKCDDCPVERVSWNDVQDFIRKLNQKTGLKYRLPTEAEWEYAARGGNQSRGYDYSGSDNIGEVAWYTNNSDSKTHGVGTKKANELGIYDMSGNVWEWCSDWYGDNYYRSSPKNDPKGPSTGSSRVRRGGGWLTDAGGCRVANRYGLNPVSRFDDLGFRLALSSE